MAPKQRPVAVFAPSVRSIKLFADGRIEYHGKSGSVIGATARIEKSGEKNRLRDTRKVVLRIDGPDVAISAPLPAAAFQLHRQADEFAAQVNGMSNGMSNGIDGSAPSLTPAEPPAPDPPAAIEPPVDVDGSVPAAAGDHEADLQAMDALIGQLERLGRLRESGVLTEAEFQQQKTALLRAAHNS